MITLKPEHILRKSEDNSSKCRFRDISTKNAHKRELSKESTKETLNQIDIMGDKYNIENEYVFNAQDTTNFKAMPITSNGMEDKEKSTQKIKPSLDPDDILNEYKLENKAVIDETPNETQRINFKTTDFVHLPPKPSQYKTEETNYDRKLEYTVVTNKTTHTSSELSTVKMTTARYSVLEIPTVRMTLTSTSIAPDFVPMTRGYNITAKKSLREGGQEDSLARLRHNLHNIKRFNFMRMNAGTNQIDLVSPMDKNKYLPGIMFWVLLIFILLAGFNLFLWWLFCFRPRNKRKRVRKLPNVLGAKIIMNFIALVCIVLAIWEFITALLARSYFHGYGESLLESLSNYYISFYRKSNVLITHLRKNHPVDNYTLPVPEVETVIHELNAYQTLLYQDPLLYYIIQELKKIITEILNTNSSRATLEILIWICTIILPIMLIIIMMGYTRRRIQMLHAVRIPMVVCMFLVAGITAYKFMVAVIIADISADYVKAFLNIKDKYKPNLPKVTYKTIKYYTECPADDSFSLHPKKDTLLEAFDGLEELGDYESEIHDIKEMICNTQWIKQFEEDVCNLTFRFVYDQYAVGIATALFITFTLMGLQYVRSKQTVILCIPLEKVLDLKPDFDKKKKKGGKEKKKKNKKEK